MKRFLCLFLAGLMLVSTLAMTACGTTEETPTDTSATTQGADQEADTNNTDYVCDLPDELDYGDETINVIFAKHPGREDELVSSGGIEAGVLSSAVYERNVAVEVDLGVKLNYIPNDTGAVAAELQKDITSGLGDYDIVADGTYKAIIPVIEGYYKDLNQTEYVDTSKHYWTQGYNEMVTFTEDHKQYLVTGPVAISLFRYMYLTIYNKDLMAAYQIPDLYETVMNGKWTLDYQLSIITGINDDTDGDGKNSEGDIHGFVTGDTISVDPYMVSCDIHMIVKDPETYALTFNADAKQRLSDLSDKVQAIYNSGDTYVYKSATMDDVGKTYITEKFTNKKALMATIQFYNMETNYNEVGALSYGIAPVPKFSEDQKSYYSYVQDQVTSLGISAGIKSGRDAMVSAVLESIGYHSHRLVRPAYYETTLSERYMKDPQSLEILELMMDSLSFDFSSTCGNIITSCVIRDQLRPVLSGTTNQISSKIAAWDRSLKRSLKTYNDKIFALE